MPKVFASVLIDTYNHERFIEDALTSVLRQDFPAGDREILVVDDGSTDRTAQILAKFSPAVRILSKPNGGQAAAFNFGIPRCQGEIIAFLDGDDWWAPNKLSSVVEAFSAHPNVGVIGHSITEVLADGTRRSELVRDHPQFRINSVAGARTFRLRKSFLGTSRMAFRADVLRHIGPAPETLVIGADEFLVTLGALFSEVLLLREPLTFFHQGQNLYLLDNRDRTVLRRKHSVLVALADALRRRFAEEQVPTEITRAVLGAVQIEADTLRLAMDEGSPLETFRTELRDYDLHHPDVPVFPRFLKCLSLVPALFLSARQYNAFKRRFLSHSFYQKARERFFPFDLPRHVDRTGDGTHR